jgi:Fe-S cluster assembly iron-binding protein IscA
MQPQVTPEQLKSLKLFAVYLQSYGAETATKEYFIEGCSIDWEDEEFRSPQTNISIETYAKIDEVLKEIVETNELIENATTDCDLRGQLTLAIDCIKRTLTAYATQWEYESRGYDFSKTLNEISEDYSEETYNEVIKLFEKIGQDGEAELQFNGGGDSGALDDFMYINGSSENVPKLIEDMAYKFLEETDIDWYNNEGGQGSFIFRPKHSDIILNVEQNYEENVDIPLNFEIKF